MSGEKHGDTTVRTVVLNDNSSTTDTVAVAAVGAESAASVQPPEIQDLQTIADSLPPSSVERTALNGIITLLQQALPNTDPKQHLNNNAEQLNGYINTLQRHPTSVWTSCKNILATLFSRLRFGCFLTTPQDNKKERGNEWMFFADGPKQKAEVAIEKIKQRPCKNRGSK